LGEDSLLLEKALKLEQERSYREAQRVYEDLVKRFPESRFREESNLAIGRCLFWVWEKEACISHLKRFLDECPTGAFREDACMILGDMALMGYCNGAEALRLYRQAGELLSDGRDKTRSKAWRLEQRLGLVHYVLGDTKSAFCCFQKARESMPQSETAYERNHYAIQVVEGFIRDHWSPTPAWVLQEGGSNARIALALGDLWYEMLDFDRARCTFDLLLNRAALLGQASRNQCAYAKIQIAQIHGFQFETSKAESMYRDVILHFPGSPVVPMAKLRLGCLLYSQSDRHLEASDMLVELYKKHPDYSKSDYGLYVAGWMKAKDGELQDAKRILAFMQSELPTNNRWSLVLAADITECEVAVRKEAPDQGQK
jgi:tetratricopeptide (TPR) repeat protein